jgi:integrase
LNKLDVQRAINEDVSGGLGYKSIKSALGLYRSALACYDVEIQPTSKFTLPQPKPKRGDLPELEKVLAVIIGSSVELPCLLALWCGGMRISEVRGLQYRDVTTSENGGHFIRINRVRICVNGHDVVQDRAKTVDSARDIPLPEYVYSLIENKPHKADTDFIVDESYKAVYKRYKLLMKKNGINMTFHELRAQFATNMSILGVKKEVLQMLGGWSNSVVLDKVYNRTPTHMLSDSMNLYTDYITKIIHEVSPESAENHTDCHTSDVAT